MGSDINRNLGQQPIAEIFCQNDLTAHDIVSNSREQITHKMVSRAIKGRMLTPNVQRKILNALNITLKRSYELDDLFNY